MVKLTKNELRDQQLKLTQLKRYLPTLQLKKAMLQAEVNAATLEIEELKAHFDTLAKKAEKSSSLLTDLFGPLLMAGVQVQEVDKKWENIAGVDIPSFEKVIFMPFEYSLMDTPLWVDAALSELRGLVKQREKIKVVEEKKEALEKELREVSIRVNLFEKIMIPRTEGIIKRIRVFLGDQQLAAVSQAKVAKRKIEERERDHRSA